MNSQRSGIPARQAVVALLLLLLPIAWVLARPQRISAEDRTRNLTEQLKLDDQQAQKVLTILRNSESEMKKIFGASGGDPESMREAIRSHRDKVNAEIESVLNAEQKAIFADIRSQGPPSRMGRRPEAK